MLSRLTIHYGVSIPVTHTGFILSCCRLSLWLFQHNRPLPIIYLHTNTNILYRHNQLIINLFHVHLIMYIVQSYGLSQTHLYIRATVTAGDRYYDWMKLKASNTQPNLPSPSLGTSRTDIVKSLPRHHSTMQPPASTCYQDGY